jgi:hypothetical protein
MIMVTCDGAVASHGLVKELDRLASRCGYQVTWSVGWALGAREQQALAKVPGTAWEAAIDGKGQVRERRSGQACGSPRCAHPACWVEEAHVTELTGLLREGPLGDQFKGWPKAMRVFARRERPHLGAQLSLLETADGWRYSLWAANLPAATRGWRGQCAYADAAHLVHARVEDVIRTGKDSGLGHFPSRDYGLNASWLDAAMTACTLLAWLKLTALDGDLAKAEPKTLRYRLLHAAPAWSAAGAEEPSRSPRTGPGPPRSSPPGSASRPSSTQPDQREPAPASRKGPPQGPWNPGHPARQPGHRHTQALNPRPETHQTTASNSHQTP